MATKKFDYSSSWDHLTIYNHYGTNCKYCIDNFRYKNKFVSLEMDNEINDINRKSVEFNFLPSFKEILID